MFMLHCHNSIWFGYIVRPVCHYNHLFSHSNLVISYPLPFSGPFMSVTIYPMSYTDISKANTMFPSHWHSVMVFSHLI